MSVCSHGWKRKQSSSMRTRDQEPVSAATPQQVSAASSMSTGAVVDSTVPPGAQQSARSSGCSAPHDLLACQPSPLVLQDSMTDLQPCVALCHRRLLRVCGCALQRRRLLRARGRVPAAGRLALWSAPRPGSPRGASRDSVLQPHARTMSGLLVYLAQKVWCIGGIGVSSSSRWLLPLSTGSSGLSVLLVVAFSALPQQETTHGLGRRALCLTWRANTELDAAPNYESMLHPCVACSRSFAQLTSHLCW